MYTRVIYSIDKLNHVLSIIANVRACYQAGACAASAAMLVLQYCFARACFSGTHEHRTQARLVLDYALWCSHTYLTAYNLYVCDGVCSGWLICWASAGKAC